MRKYINNHKIKIWEETKKDTVVEYHKNEKPIFKANIWERQRKGSKKMVKEKKNSLRHIWNEIQTRKWEKEKQEEEKMQIKIIGQRNNKKKQYSSR